MITTLIASIAIAQGGGAPMVGFTKADCVLTKIKGTPRIAFMNPTATGETDLHEYVEMVAETDEVGEYPRWVKLRGMKASPNARTVVVTITQSVETATTFKGPYDVFRVQARYPSLFVDVKESGWAVHISEDKVYKFPLPAGATTAKFKCDTPWIDARISGVPDIRGEATSRSYVKKCEVTTP